MRQDEGNMTLAGTTTHGTQSIQDHCPSASQSEHLRRASTTNEVYQVAERERRNFPERHTTNFSVPHWRVLERNIITVCE